MTAAPGFRPDALAMLEEAKRQITEPGCEPFASEAIEAARRRLADVPPSDDLETRLHLANRFTAGRYTVGSALAIIDALPDFDPLDRNRPADPFCRRHGVQQLAFVVEDAS